MIIIQQSTLNDFNARGFVTFPKLLDPDLLQSAAEDGAALIAALAEDSAARRVLYTRNDRVNGMVRIDHPHTASSTIRDVITHSALATAAARLMNACAVQVWYCHLLCKPPFPNGHGHVGWHQDGQYASFFTGRFVTAWIPLTNVTLSSSPLCYISGSHKGRILQGSGFSHLAPLEQLKDKIQDSMNVGWDEVEIETELGAITMHDSMVIHGSRANASDRPRMSLAVHMRSNHNRLNLGNPHIDLGQLSDPRLSPVIFGEPGALDFGFS